LHNFEKFRPAQKLACKFLLNIKAILNFSEKTWCYFVLIAIESFSIVPDLVFLGNFYGGHSSEEYLSLHVK